MFRLDGLLRDENEIGIRVNRCKLGHLETLHVHTWRFLFRYSDINIVAVTFSYFSDKVMVV